MNGTHSGYLNRMNISQEVLPALSREVSMTPPPSSPSSPNPHHSRRRHIPSGPEIQLRHLHSRFLALIPTHLVGAAFFMLQYVASFRLPDHGRALLAVYVQFVDVTDFHIPALARQSTAIVYLDTAHLNHLRKRILRLYLFLATYVFSLTGRDCGLELTQEYDALVHVRQTRATLITCRLNLAEHAAEHFVYARCEGQGNPALTKKERFWFLAMADQIFMTHAYRLGYNEDSRGMYEDALADVIIRFANNCPPNFPIVRELPTDVMP